jgi:hypothetical protein
MAELGRISGQMLTANLERLGVDLAFETDQLYLDVSARGIGINTDAFSRQLEVNGTTQTQSLITPRVDVGGLTIQTNQISSLSGPIYISASGGQNGTVLFDRNETDGLYFDGNVIGSKVLNSSIELRPHGSGVVSITDNVEVYSNIHVTGNIQIDGDLGFKGQLIVGDSTSDTVTINPEFTQSLTPYTDNTYNLGSSTKFWGGMFLSQDTQLNFGNIRAQFNTIETTVSNSNLELYGSAAGGVLVESLRFNDNVITGTSGSIGITPNVVFDKTTAIVAPVGTTANRPVLTQADFRYNTTLDTFEGSTTAKIQFNGVADADGNTRVIASRPRTLNNDTLSFFANGSLVTTINPTAVSVTTFEINQTLRLASSGTLITTVQNNLDINLLVSGTAKINTENIGFNQNTIYGLVDNIELDTTGRGYYVLAGSNGMVIPNGPTLTTIPPTTQLGDFRYNTSIGEFEVYDGVAYGQITGSGQTVTVDQMEEFVDIYTLILG